MWHATLDALACLGLFSFAETQLANRPIQTGQDFGRKYEILPINFLFLLTSHSQPIWVWYCLLLTFIVHQSKVVFCSLVYKLTLEWTHCLPCCLLRIHNVLSINLWLVDLRWWAAYNYSSHSRIRSSPDILLMASLCGERYASLSFTSWLIDLCFGYPSALCSVCSTSANQHNCTNYGQFLREWSRCQIRQQTRDKNISRSL